MPGLYDIVSTASTKKVEKHGQMLWKGHSVSGKVSYGYCPFCSYTSTNHRTATDRNPQMGYDGDNSVPGFSLQYGMDLTVYMAVIEDPERMSSRIGCEVRSVWLRHKHPLVPIRSLSINLNSWGKSNG